MRHEEFLYQVTSLLDKNNIPYVLFAGTLLSAVRDGKFLPSDFCDTDILVEDKHYWDIRYLMDKEVNEGRATWAGIRRKELTVRDVYAQYKVDIFFAETVDNKYAVYSYKPNSVNKKWNHEWRAFFTKENFFPSSSILFLGYEFKIPNDYNAVLTEEYGDWKTPNHNWISSDKTVLNVDLEYKGFFPAEVILSEHLTNKEDYQVGIICINLLRKECTIKCIESLKNIYPNAKIYVVDQDAPCAEMMRFYEKHNIEYYYLPFDCGLSYARNFLLDHIKEPYIMWIDNDFVFDEKNGINDAITILESSPEIGVVGGCILKNGIEQHYERMLLYDETSGILVYIPLELTSPQKCIHNDIPFYYCDLTFNYAIAKKEVFNHPMVRWFEQLKVSYEHTDAFLRFKLFSGFKTVYLPSMKVHHNHVDSLEYKILRFRKCDATKFAEHWGLKMNFTVGQGQEVYKAGIVIREQKLKCMLFEPIHEEEIAVEEVLKKLIALNIPFCLIKNSVKEILLNKTLSFPISILVNKIEEKKAIVDILNNTVDVSIGAIKSLKYKITPNINIYLPINPEIYLKMTYGDNWKESNE